MSYELQKQKREARRQIDQLAEETRQRYLTPLAFQDLVYAVKLRQAQDYLVAYAGDAEATVPGYVEAEATATATAPNVAATAIVTAAQSFHDGPGPEIEQQRRSAKIAVNAALDAEGVGEALAAGLSALSSI